MPQSGEASGQGEPVVLPAKEGIVRQVSFSVPGIPHGKGRPRAVVVNGHARVFTPKATRVEEGAVRLIAKSAMRGQPPIDGPVEVEIIAYMPIPRSWSGAAQRRAMVGLIQPTGRPDLDNLFKTYGDGMNAIVYRDDAQVVAISVRKVYSLEPRTEIRVLSLVPPTKEEAERRSLYADVRDVMSGAEMDLSFPRTGA